MTEIKTLDDALREFDMMWGIAPDGTPKHDRGEWIKNHIRSVWSAGVAEGKKECKENRMAWGCPECKRGMNSPAEGGNEKCFHCHLCGYIECGDLAPQQKEDHE